MSATYSPDTSRHENALVIGGLCTIVASLMLMEVCLTKFVSYKVFHHFVYAVISTVILSSGFAGVCVNLFSKRFGKDNPNPWAVAARSALAYAILLPLATLVFCWLPLDPYMQQIAPHGTSPPGILTGYFFLLAPLVLYFVLFAIPFFFAGLCISITLVASKLPAARIYCYDLLAAAAGALLCPFALEWLGGYGTVILAALLGLSSCFVFTSAAKSKLNIMALGSAATACLLLLCYPQWAISRYGFDIRSSKNRSAQQLMAREFGGIKQTYWNAIARIDVSDTRVNQFFEYFYKPDNPLISSRFILVDGGAPTRQMTALGDLEAEPHLTGYLWASPYIAHPNTQHSLIIGPGGGIDILIAKRFKVGQIDAVELNPSTYKHVLRGRDDSQAPYYQPWLGSTAQSTVRIHNSEARHFCTTQPERSVDVIHASGVDTLTAITSGALSMVDNYLYTSEAIKDYIRILKPDGVLSLTHWRIPPVGSALREFETYLDVLEGMGISQPGRCVLVTGNDWWVDLMLKTTPWTHEEVEAVRTWSDKHHLIMLYDPLRDPKTIVPGMFDTDKLYGILGHATLPERQAEIARLTRDIKPATDDKPFFYEFDKGDNFYTSECYSTTPTALLLITIFFSLGLFLLPLARMQKSQFSSLMRSLSACFALAGFAFLLFEAALIQSFTVFAGGPLYSLAVVLVCVLAGYALGSRLSEALAFSGATFIKIGIAIFVLFIGLYLLLPHVLAMLMPLPEPGRIAATAAISFSCSVVTGLPVSLAMTGIKEKYGDTVAWMWGIGCAANAVGAMAFAPIAHITGVAFTIFISGLLYLLANLALGYCAKSQTVKPASSLTETA